MTRLLLAVVCVMALTGCVSSEQIAQRNEQAGMGGPGGTRNTDPRAGWVEIWEGVEMKKKCDGTTLVYDGHNSMAVIRDSPECAR